jgi:hypothetical protein
VEKNINHEAGEGLDIGETNKSKTYRIWTPCDNIYVTIASKNEEPDKIDFIRISGGTKDNECGCSFLDSLADLLTFSIRRIRNIHESRAICKNLRMHRCNKVKPNREHITSCADALGRVLEKELLKGEIP